MEELWQKYEHLGEMLKKAERRNWDPDMVQNILDAFEVMMEIIGELSVDTDK